MAWRRIPQVLVPARGRERTGTLAPQGTRLSGDLQQGDRPGRTRSRLGGQSEEAAGIRRRALQPHSPSRRETAPRIGLVSSALGRRLEVVSRIGPKTRRRVLLVGDGIGRHVKIAITGANSGVGSILLRHLVSCGDIHVVACVRSAHAAAALPVSPRISARAIDYGDREGLASALSGTSCVVHLAGILFESPASTYRNGQRRGDAGGRGRLQKGRSPVASCWSAFSARTPRRPIGT